MTLFITESDVERMLSIRAAIPVMEETFRMAGEGTAENPPRTILFESHGLAIEDVAIAARAYEIAKAQGIGTEISL